MKRQPWYLTIGLLSGVWMGLAFAPPAGPQVTAGAALLGGFGGLLVGLLFDLYPRKPR